jgi:hypothetical protein
VCIKKGECYKKCKCLGGWFPVSADGGCAAGLAYEKSANSEICRVACLPAYLGCCGVSIAEVFSVCVWVRKEVVEWDPAWEKSNFVQKSKKCDRQWRKEDAITPWEITPFGATWEAIPPKQYLVNLLRILTFTTPWEKTVQICWTRVLLEFINNAKRPRQKGASHSSGGSFKLNCLRLVMNFKHKREANRKNYSVYNSKSRATCEKCSREFGIFDRDVRDFIACEYLSHYAEYFYGVWFGLAFG